MEPLGILNLPIPGVSAHLFQVFLCLPTEQGLRFFRVGVTNSNIARPSVCNFIRDFFACHFIEIMDNIQYTVAGASTKIKGFNSRMRLQVFQRFDMSSH